MRLRYHAHGGPRGPYAAVVEELQADPRVAEAGRIGYTFKLDPLSILNAGRPLGRSEDWKDRAIRAACHNVVIGDLSRKPT